MVSLFSGLEAGVGVGFWGGVGVLHSEVYGRCFTGYQHIVVAA